MTFDNTESSDTDSVLCSQTASTTSETVEKVIHRNLKCEFCDLRFRRKDAFDRHQFSHTGKRNYACHFADCNKNYTNSSHLKRHIRSNHERPRNPIPPAEKLVQCTHQTCLRFFSTEASMKRHYLNLHVVEMRFICAHCSEEFRRKRQLKLHMVKHTGVYPHKCEKCGRGFVNLKAWRSHKQAHLPHKCENCPKLFEHWSEMVAHKKQDHALEFKCPDCNKVFHSKKNYKLHSKTHLNSDDLLAFPCTYENCGRSYTQARNLKAHIKSKHLKSEKFVCTFEGCARELSTKQKLELHLKLHDKNHEIMKKPTCRAPRKLRKDAGMAKKSNASQLSALEFDKDVERALMNGDGPSFVIDKRLLIDSASESEVEIDRIVNRQLKSFDNELDNLLKF